MFAERAGLPDQLAQLYESALETMFRTWPTTRGKSRLSVRPDELRAALAAAALWMQRMGLTRIGRRDLERVLAASVPRGRQPRPEQLARDYVRAFSQEAGLLLEPEPDKFEFLHLTFGEYLAAIELLDEAAEAELVEHRADTRWAQVTHFAAVVLFQVRKEPERAGRLLTALAEEPAGTLLTLQHSHLPLVADCLADGGELPASILEPLQRQILRAATLPLAAPAQAAAAVINRAVPPASDSLLGLLKPLCLHVDVQVRLSVARLAAACAEHSDVAYELCVRLIDENAAAIQCHAALGMLAPGRPLNKWNDGIFKPLARCLDPKIGAADAASALLQRRPDLEERIRLLRSQDRPESTWSAALLLSLLHPEDATLLDTLLAVGDRSRSGDSQLALVRAAQRSASALRFLIDQFAALPDKSGTVSRSNHGTRRNVLEATLTELCLGSAEVRAQLFARLHPAEPFAIPCLDDWLAWVAQKGTEPRSERLRRIPPAQLGEELLAQLSREPSALHMRIASLLAKIGAPSPQIAQALLPCISAEPALRLPAIKLAQDYQLARLEAQGWLCTLSEAVGELWHKAHRALLRLSKQASVRTLILEELSGRSTSANPAERLTATVVLYEAGSFADSALDLDKRLTAYLHGGAAWLRWPAAKPLIRRLDALPEETQVLLIALWQGHPAMTWPAIEAPDAQQEKRWPIPDREPRRTPVPRDQDFTIRCERLLATWVRTQAPALGRVLAHCIEFLNEAVRQGAAIHPYYEFDTSAWFRHALLRSPLQRSRLVHALGGDDEAAKEVAKKLLYDAVRPWSAPQSLIANPLSEPPADLIAPLTESARDASPAALCELIALVRWFGIQPGDATQPEVTRLLADDSTPGNLKLRLLQYLDDLSCAEAHAALTAGLKAEKPSWRYYAAEICHERVPDRFPLRPALLPCLGDAVPPTVRLHAAALLSLLPDFQPSEVRAALLFGLETKDKAAFCHRQLFADVLEKYSPRTDDRLLPYSEQAWLSHIAALLLVAFNLEPQTLEQVAIGWLERSTEALLAKRELDRESQSRSKEPSRNPSAYEEQRLALHVLVLVGSVSERGDLALAGLLRINQWTEFLHAVKELGRDSEAVLRALVPWCLDRNHRGMGIREWLTARAQANPGCRERLCQVLGETMASTDLNVACEAAAWLVEFAALFGETAQRFVKISLSPDINRWSLKERQAIYIDNRHIVEGILAAFYDDDPFVCFRAWDLLMGADGSIALAAELRQPLIAALRSWLAHTDWALRVEGVRELRNLGHIDPAEAEVLRAALQLPLDWQGAYSAAAVRFHAAQLWLERPPGPISAQELLAALQPILTRADSYCLDNQRALRFLDGLEECRAETLRIYGEFLSQLAPRQLGYWESLELWRSLGGPLPDTLRLALRYFADPHAAHPEYALWLLLHPELDQEARKKLDVAEQEQQSDADAAEIKPAGPPGVPLPFRPNVAAESPARRHRLLGSTAGRAQLFAESSVPKLVLELLKEALAPNGTIGATACLPPDFLDSTIKPGTAEFELLAELAHHRAEDTAVAQFSRWFLLFRCFGPFTSQDAPWILYRSDRSWF